MPEQTTGDRNEYRELLAKEKERGEDRRQRDERRSYLRERRREARVRKLLIAGGVLVVILAIPLVWPEPHEGQLLDAPPAELRGTWVTDAEAYADRSFIVHEDALDIYVGDDQWSSHMILETRELDRGEGREIVMIYDSPDGDQEFDVVLHADGTLRLRNPEYVVWTRLEDGGSPSGG